MLNKELRWLFQQRMGIQTVMGGSGDNGKTGAAWVFTRSGGTWTQQGSKLVGSGVVGPAEQGSSVGISADGNTIVMGGYFDNTGNGAAWIFTRTGVNWTQQGSKLTTTTNIGQAWLGNSVSITGDGNAVMLGGPRDNNDQGAAWIFTRSGTTWAEEAKLIGSTGPILRDFFIAGFCCFHFR